METNMTIMRSAKATGTRAEKGRAVRLHLVAVRLNIPHIPAQGNTTTNDMRSP